MLFISNFRRYASKGFSKQKIINFQNKLSLSTTLLNRTKASFSSVNLIQDVNEIKEGSKFYEENNFASAQELLEKALNILPFYLEGNPDFNTSFESFLEQLIKTYAWRGKISKIEAITARIINQGKQKKIESNESISNILQVQSIVGKNSVQVTQERQIVKQLFNTSLLRYKQNDYKIEKQLSFKDKTSQTNQASFEPWIHGELRNTWSFVLLSILNRHNIYLNENYNKLCSTLLKNTERSNQKNIIKPLILLVTNLLRNQQYLQAEGMISYCLDRKKQNLKPQILINNQEYITLNILLGHTFMGVKRESQGSKLLSDYRKLFNLESLIIQGYLLDSI